MTTTSTSISISRPEMISAIKLRDPSFNDSSSHSIDYVAGRYSASISMQPVVGIARSSAPAEVAAKLDETDLSPVTRAQIAAENDRDRVRSMVSAAPTKRVDEADADLSPVTRAMIAAHNLADRRNRGGFDGSGGDAA